MKKSKRHFHALNEIQTKLKKNILIQLFTLFLSDKENDFFKDLFYFYDQNNNGFVTKKELEEGLIKRGNTGYEEDLENMFKKASNQVNLQGLDYNDFIQVTMHYDLFLKEEKLAKVFKVYDTSNNGVITKLDLQRVLQRQSHEYDDAMLEDWMNQFDLDQDGSISFEEFKNKMLEL